MKYRTVLCESCHGAGSDEHGECLDCDGYGHITVADPDSFRGPALWMVLVAGVLVIVALVEWMTR